MSTTASPLAASPAYRFARNPVTAIRDAVVGQLVAYGKGPRLTWNAVVEKSGAPAGSPSLSFSQFAEGVKRLGTGVVLAACDVELAFCSDDSDEDDGVSFAQFSALLQ